MKLGLPPEYFRDPAIYARESERIFERSWLCIDRASNLAGSGTFRTYTVAGKPLIVTNDGGKKRAFFNVCRHRGAILCSDSQGSLNDGDDCIQCPYHAWAYGADGTLRRAPNMQSEAGFDSDQFGLVSVDCVEWQGFVLINLAGSADPEAKFKSDFESVFSTFAPWGLEDLLPGAELKYDVCANWKLLFQNFSECYHCPTVHPLLSRMTPYKSATNDLTTGAYLGGPMQLSNGVETMSMDGKLVGTVLAGLDDEQRHQVGYYTLFPSVFISPHPDYVMVHYLNRQSVDRTQVRCQLLFDPDFVADRQASVERAMEFWDTTNRQDWQVCELVQQGTAAGLPPGPYSPLEPVLPMIDKYYLSQMK